MILTLEEAARQDREAARIAKQKDGDNGVEDSDSDDDGASLSLAGCNHEEEISKDEKMEGWTIKNLKRSQENQRF